MKFIVNILKLCSFILFFASVIEAKNNHVTCQQIADVVENGQRYMQFVFTDGSGNYTAGYLESYDDPGKGSFVSYIHPISLKNQSVLQMQQLQQLHSASIASLKQHTLASSSVIQRQQVDQLFLQGRISAEEAMAYYQQIEYAPLVSQAIKQAQSLRKKNKKKQVVVSEKKSQSKLPQQVTKKSNISSQEIHKLREHNNQVLKNHNTHDSSYQQAMDKRSKAFEVSEKNQMLTTEQVKINDQTTAFLQAQDIDILQFQQIEGLPIQHQLTYELVDILDAVAQYAQQHQYEMYQTHLTKYCAHLASLSQQANHQGALQQAIDGTNCCHGIQHYLQGMVSGVAQAYQQFQTALDYFDTVVDRYGNLIVQQAAQGALIAHGLEAIVTAGLIVAPTATIAATGVMIGATAYVMAPLCAQAMIDTAGFGGACIRGDWDKVARDLDNFGKFISSKETVARMAELAGGAAMPTPNLNNVVEQVLSLRPVITSVQNASGEMVQSLYLMTKNQLQKVYAQGVELLQLPEFVNFNMSYKKICGFNFFDILPQTHPALAFAMEGIEAGLFNSAEQTMITQLFTQSEGSVAGNVITSGASQVINSLATTTTQLIQNKVCELINLVPQIRQLQDLAKYTNNFQNLENLIPEDICYLNRIHELQAYRAQITNFLNTHKPYFMHDGQVYFIEDIASYHIHAGDYFLKKAPKGGHSNYGGHKLNYFNPELVAVGPQGTKKVQLCNSRFPDEVKDSSLYPETWSEYMCDLKAFESITSTNTFIKKSAELETLEITGQTLEGLKIQLFYDIKTSRIKSHYPKFD